MAFLASTLFTIGWRPMHNFLLMKSHAIHYITKKNIGVKEEENKGHWVFKECCFEFISWIIKLSKKIKKCFFLKYNCMSINVLYLLLFVLKVLTQSVSAQTFLNQLYNLCGFTELNQITIIYLVNASMTTVLCGNISMRFRPNII